VTGQAPRRALILAGGGMRVAWQAGVIRALAEASLDFPLGDGTSGGILNLAMLYSGLTPEQMCDRWRTLEVRRFFSPAPASHYLRALNAPALGDADGVIEHVFPHLGIDIERIHVDPRDGVFNVCDFSTKQLLPIPHREVTRDELVAGISLPILMPAVSDGEAELVDAVWIKDANLLEAVRRGADELWLVWCIGNTATYRDGLLNQYVHMIEMSAHGALFEEFDRLREMNERIAAGQTVWGHDRPLALHLIRPEYPLPLDPDLYSGGIDTATLIDMGYADAWRYLSQKSDAGLDFAPRVTQMREPGVAISFRETMSGPFAFDHEDPEAGASRGEVEGGQLVIHAGITVRDVDRFIADPEHTGEMSARIDCSPLGKSLPAKSATFNLFVQQPGARTMVYEAAFSADGSEYYLAGAKVIRNDAGPDLWADTTTMPVRLHRGDRSGPVVGAGIVHLSARELVRLSLSMRVRGADSAREGAAVLGRFGGFFMGELWKAYAPPFAHVGSWWRRMLASIRARFRRRSLT
jgi:predicted acylesterase/phospholipase RssA